MANVTVKSGETKIINDSNRSLDKVTVQPAGKIQINTNAPVKIKTLVVK